MGGSAPAPVQYDTAKMMPPPNPQSTYDMLGASMKLGQSALDLQRGNISLASKMPPRMLEYNPTEVSQQAYEFGLGNIQRSREGEQLTDPFAAEMRMGLSQQVAEATDPNKLEDFLSRFARERGITSIASTGIDPSSTIGRSALFDKTAEAGRNMMFDNIAKRQAFLQATPAPMGGIDPGASVAAQQAIRDANTGSMNAFQAQNLQNAFGMGQSYSDFVNKMMGETLSANQAEQANLRNYQEQLINNLLGTANSTNAANAAASAGQQAQTGQLIAGGGAAIGGLATAAAAAIMI
jgi:hypothetical protein